MIRAVFLLLVATSVASAEQTFTPLGHLFFDGGVASFPTDVSADGSVVVGYVSDDPATDPTELERTFGFRWSDDGTQTKVPCIPYTVSNDGRTLAGSCDNASDDPVLLVDGVPVALPVVADDSYSPPTMVSGDGNVAFGTRVYTPSCTPELCSSYGEVVRFANGTVERLGFLPGDLGSEIRAISSDGSVAAIVNYLPSSVPEEDYLHWRVARWQGSMTDVGTLPPGADMFATDISADGSTIVGFSIVGEDDFFFTAWKWTAAGGLVELPAPFGGTAGTVTATSISGDGKTIVGGYLDGEMARRAVFWTEDDGARDLQDYMELSVGVDLQGWDLLAATAISRDGQTIAGVGMSPSWPYPTSWRIGPPPSQLQMRVEAARMTIPDYKGDDEHEFRRDPAIVTVYGHTVVPIVVSVADETNDGEPLPDATVTMSVEGVGVEIAPSLIGLNLDPDDPNGQEELVVDTGPSGEVTVYLHVDELYSNVIEDDPNATGITATARWEGIVETTTIPVEDNRQTILERYRAADDYIPDGARATWRDAFLPPLEPSDYLTTGLPWLVNFGNLNNVSGTTLCTTYQQYTLVFLNDIRHSDDGWLFNGLDYSPLQLVAGEHHFVGLYPHELAYDDVRSVILDPWLAQTRAFFTFGEFAAFMKGPSNIAPDVSTSTKNPGTCVTYCGGQLVPFPYPAAGGRYPYFADNAAKPIAQRSDGCQRVPGTGSLFDLSWCERHGLSGDASKPLAVGEGTDHATVVVGSPVQFLVTQPDGKRFGFTGGDAGSYVNEVAADHSIGFVSLPEPDGSRGWHVDVPPGRAFRLDFPAIADGTMDVAVLAPLGGVWGGWFGVPITAGQTVSLDVDLDAACPAIAVPGRIAVPCDRPTACTSDAECPSADPCTPRACVEGACSNRPVDGLAAAACACDRPKPAACDAPKLPGPLAKATKKACKLLKSNGMSSEKKRAKLLAKAAKGWTSATKALGKRAVTKKTSEACRAALGQHYADAGARLESVRGSVPRDVHRRRRPLPAS